MSQTMISRPGSQASRVGVLPRIEHPLSRLENPDKISIRGMSRASNRQENAPMEKPFSNTRLQTMSPRRKDLNPKMPIDTIPEGVEVIHSTDPNKTTLPIFGNRAVMSRAESRGSNVSRFSSLSRPGTQTRIEIDQIEMQLRDKIKSGGFFSIRQAFKNNDPEGKGNVSREALMHILSSILGRMITSKQFHLLLKRLHLDNKVIKFEEFYAQFRESVSSEYPRWLDPVARTQTERASMNASQVHAQLKEKAKQRFLDLADLVPQMNPGGSGRIMAPEFRNVLNKLGYFMDDAEFEKLWKKYDAAGLGVVKAEVLLKKLGIEFRESKTPSSSKFEPMNDVLLKREDSREYPPASGRSLRRSEADRRTSIDIEKWLKDKFREGFKSMKSEFRKGDRKNTGKVSRDVFRRVLSQYDLYLREDSALNMFLARCGLSEKGDISYVDFLNKFQDRSEAGMAHNILSNPKHRFNKDPRPVSPKSTVTAVEAKMMSLFQSDFLALLGMFHKIDKHHQDIISQQEFRAAIESRFQLEMEDEEFESFMEQVPLNEDGDVKYPEFMAQFDTKKGAKSLWDGKSVITTASKPAPPRQRDTETRTLEDLHAILRDFVRNDMNRLESEFRQLDEFNSGRLTQEMMFQLLTNMNIKPKVTRGEIRKLWETFIVNKNRTLSFLQFVRHYGYSLKSAAFPNAKIAPPLRGDNDFMIRSRKLNCAADMLEDNLRAKVDYLWEDLRREFVEMDPYHTGFVSRDEFRDVLMELCVHLTNHETEIITNKFDTNGDGRISYVEFLRPFAQRRQLWKEGNNMMAVLTHPQSELPASMIAGKPTQGLEAVTSKLKQQLAGDWRTLRRAFKKMDVSSDGMLTLPEFRSVLRLCNVVLDEDEVYHVLSKYDESMTGKLNYKKFLNETASRSTSRNSIA